MIIWKTKFSSRSTKYLPNENTRVRAEIDKAWKNLYSDKNPNGIVNLSIGENNLLSGWLVQKFKENFDLETSDLDYHDVDGHIMFKEAVSHIANQYFNPVVPVKTEHVVCGAGVAAILPQLIYAICDEGDSVLIAKPYYMGFDHLAKQGVNLIGLTIENIWDAHSVLEALEKAYKDTQPSEKIKAVMLCNPNNPLGYCASKEILITYMKFCQDHQLQFIVDEVYALSVFKEDDNSLLPSKFISTLSINPAEFGFDPSRLHVLYAISKDFGCGGFRGGALISQHNPDLLALMKKLNLNQVQISTLTARSFYRLVFHKDQVKGTSLLDSYLVENKKLILKSYEYATKSLDALKIKYNEGASSGFFLMIDLSKYLSAPTEPDLNEEESCLLKLIKEYKLLLSPGLAYHNPKPGFFRLTFTAPPDHLELAMQKLATFIHSFDVNHSATTKS